MMEGLDGFETCRRLKAAEATRAIPVIFLTSLERHRDQAARLQRRRGRLRDQAVPDRGAARAGRDAHRLRREIEAHRKSRSTIQYLVEEIRAERHSIVGDSPALRHVLQQIAQVAPTDSTVLVLGETGTGKELVARAIHEASARRERPLVKLNCAALPRELVESELFGHEKGAFTGAHQQRRGRFEARRRRHAVPRRGRRAAARAQAKLLRVLQEREFERVGRNAARCASTCA